MTDKEQVEMMMKARELMQKHQKIEANGYKQGYLAALERVLELVGKDMISEKHDGGAIKDIEGREARLTVVHTTPRIDARNQLRAELRSQIEAEKLKYMGE